MASLTYLDSMANFAPLTPGHGIGNRYLFLNKSHVCCSGGGFNEQYRSKSLESWKYKHAVRQLLFCFLICSKANVFQLNKNKVIFAAHDSL